MKKCGPSLRQAVKARTNSLAYRRHLAQSAFDEMFGGPRSCEQIIPQRKIASQRCRKKRNRFRE